MSSKNRGHKFCLVRHFCIYPIEKRAGKGRSAFWGFPMERQTVSEFFKKTGDDHNEERTEYNDVSTGYNEESIEQRKNRI